MVAAAPMVGDAGQGTEETEMPIKPSFLAPAALLRPFASSTAADSPPRVHPEVEAWAMRAATANGFGGDPAGSGRAAAARPAPAQAQASAFIDLSDPLASAVVRARRYARRAAALLRLLVRRARHRAELRQLQALDAATLRDLGLTRSEIGSVHAESAGRAVATRRALAEHEWIRFRAGVSAVPGAAF
jgi:uncharacterized protein YjiS (DUF1127 family)